MNEPNIERIRKYLQDQEVQERIQERMLDARSKATVTISRAAKLFDFSESQLREWEKRGLLKTERTALSEDSKTSTGHRQFSPDELDKLALIRELIDQKYSVSEIPQNQVLRLSLMLLCEDMSDTIAGLIIPLQKKDALKEVYRPGDQPEVGSSLVGWLGENRSFHSFLDAAPSFEFPSDFRIQPFPVVGEGKQQDNVLIFIQRGAKALPLSAALVETIRSLLDLLYQHVEQWRLCFDYGMRDWEYQITDFTNPNATDEVLNSIADMVVELGAKTSDGRDRWHFASLFLPKDPDLPIQQRNLVVRAQSKCSLHQVDLTSVNTKDPGLSFRAYQSGHVIYRPEIAPQDFILALPLPFQ